MMNRFEKYYVDVLDVLPTITLDFYGLKKNKQKFTFQDVIDSKHPLYPVLEMVTACKKGDIDSMDVTISNLIDGIVEQIPKPEEYNLEKSLVVGVTIGEEFWRYFYLAIRLEHVGVSWLPESQVTIKNYLKEELNVNGVQLHA